jgi:hypothetical protein
MPKKIIIKSKIKGYLNYKILGYSRALYLRIWVIIDTTM